MKRYIKSDIDPNLKSDVKDRVRQELENIKLPEHYLFDSFGDEIHVYVDHPYEGDSETVEIAFWIQYDYDILILR